MMLKMGHSTTSKSDNESYPIKCRILEYSNNDSGINMGLYDVCIFEKRSLRVPKIANPTTKAARRDLHRYECDINVECQLTFNLH